MHRAPTATRRDGFVTRRLLLSLGVALATLVPVVIVPVYGDQIYLALTGITGEATTKGYEKTIAVGSMQWGAGRGISWVGGASSPSLSNVSVSEVTTTKSTDSTSAFLFERLTLGTVTATAKFTIVTDAGLKRLEVELGNAYLSGFSQSAGAGGVPSESFSLNFQTIKVTPYNAAGTAGTPKTWNLPGNTP